MSGPSGQVSPKKLVKQEKRRQAVSLRAQGLTLEAVGERLGCTEGYVRRLLRAAMAETAAMIAEDVSTLRARDLQQLDEAAAVLWPQVQAGDTRAHDSWLRNRARHAELTGIDVKRDEDHGPQVVVIAGRPWEASPPASVPAASQWEDPAPRGRVVTVDEPARLPPPPPEDDGTRGDPDAGRRGD